MEILRTKREFVKEYAAQVTDDSAEMPLHQPTRIPPQETIRRIIAKKVRFQAGLSAVLSGPTETRTDLLQKAIDANKI